MFNKLHHKILPIIFIALTLTVSINYIISNHFLKKELLLSISSQAFSNGENLKLQIQRYLMTETTLSELEDFDTICSELVTDNDLITYVMVSDLDGNILFNSTELKQVKIPQHSSLYKSLQQEEYSMLILDWEGTSYLLFTLPILNPYSQPIGSIILCYSEKAINTPLHTISILTLIASLIMLLFELIVTAIAIYCWVTKPLRRLHDATREVFYNGTEAINMVDIQSKDEIGQLATSFNTMIEQLKTSTVSKAFLDNIISSMTDALLVIDANKQIKMINDATTHLLGYEATELIGQPVAYLFEEGENPFEGDSLERLKAQGQLKNIEVHFKSKTNELISILLGCSMINSESKWHIVCAARDITEIKKADELIVYQANHDIVTDLVNRYFLESEINKLLSDSPRQVHTFLSLDLDKFKIINDVCGHHAGDQLLKSLAVIMKINLREDDIIARIGGDEFAVLLRNTSIEAGYHIGERLCKVIKDFHFCWEQKPFSLGVSIGAVELNEETPSCEWLLSVADRACYLSKEKGGNRVQIFNSEQEEFSNQYQQLDMMPSITTAFAENRFFLHYQPIASSFLTHKRQWYEVLIRMKDEADKMIYPNIFLSAAQRYNMLPAIDHWVIEHFFSNYWQLVATYNLTTPHLFNINLSGASLNTNDFFDFIYEQFQRYKVPPEVICFEITETSVVANFAEASEFINKLKAMGCLFALDDFGTGLSSFSYLKYLPVDFLKIDGEFVKDMDHNKVDYAMVSSINEIAHLMGKQTIAEYVENTTLLNCLQEIGVDFAQGYGLGRPAPLNEATSFFKPQS